MSNIDLMNLDEQLKTCREFIGLVHTNVGADSQLLGELLETESYLKEKRAAKEKYVWENVTLPRIHNFIKANLEEDASSNL